MYPSLKASNLEPGAAPALSLQLLTNGLDAFAVDVAVRLTHSRGGSILYSESWTWLKPELHIVNELQRGDEGGAVEEKGFMEGEAY